VFIPIGDYPNPRKPQWVTRILLGLNIAVYVFLTLPLQQGLEESDLDDPATRAQLEEMWRVQEPAVREYYRKTGQRVPPEMQQSAWLRSLTKYDLFVDRHGYKPGDPSLFALLFCMFLHANFLHLAGNMLFLWIFGDNVEARLGRGGYVAGYLVTGVVATLAFALMAGDSLTPLIGASGAISGVLGFYLVWFPYNQIRVLLFVFFYLMFVHVRAVWVLAFYLVVDNLLPLLRQQEGGGGGVAYGAHIGGFVAGVLGAFLWNRVRGRVPAPHPQPHVERRATPWTRGKGPIRLGAADAFHAAVHMGRLEEAAHAFSRLAREGGAPPLPDDVFALGRWLYENEFAHDAAAVLRYYVANYPRGDDLDRVHLALGVLLGRRLAQPAAAREHLLSAIDLTKDETLAAKAREELDRLP